MSKPARLFTYFCVSSFISISSAQADDPENSDKVKESAETVVVSGSRSGETLLQDTPIAITAVSGEELAARHFEAAEDLRYVTPGLTFSENGRLAQVYIRGIGSNLVFAGADPSTAVHWDGVYLARPGMVFSDFINLERVEVLRGPQGTLYGRNSTGGTINLISALPEDEFTFRGGLEVGSYDLYRINGDVSFPIVPGEVAAGISFFGGERDGYVNNLNEDGAEKLNSEAKFGVQTTIHWFGLDNADWVFRVDFSRSDDQGLTYKPTLTTETGASRAVFAPDDPQNKAHTVDINADPSLVVENAGFSATGTFQLSDTLSFNSLTAYRTYDLIAAYDSDFTATDVRFSRLAEEQSQFSQEFGLTADFGAVTLVAGLYYFLEDHKSDFNADIIILPALGTTFINLDVETTVLAAFSNATWHLTDDLNLWAGVRATTEEKEIDGELASTGPRKEDDDWSAVTPSAGLDYRFNQDVMLYGSLSSGYKSGGFNFTLDEPSYDEETVTALEFGAKTDYWDDRLITNLAIFYYDYEDLQVLGYVSEGTIATTPINNAAEAEITGFEYEGLIKPIDNLTIALTYAYLDASYESFVGARPVPPGVSAVPLDLSGNKLDAAPQETYSALVRYSHSTSQGELSYSVSYFFQDETFLTRFNDEMTTVQPYSLVNADIKYTCQGGKMQFALYGKNLTETNYFTSVQTFSPLGVNRSLHPPRTIGFKMNYTL